MGKSSRVEGERFSRGVSIAGMRVSGLPLSADVTESSQIPRRLPVESKRLETKAREIHWFPLTLNLPQPHHRMMTNHHKLRALDHAQSAGCPRAADARRRLLLLYPGHPRRRSLRQELGGARRGLERELNTMSNDDKGKNVTNSTDVPTFPARGRQRRAATHHLGRPALSLQLRQRGLPVPRRRQRTPAQPLSVPPAAEPELHAER